MIFHKIKRFFQRGIIKFRRFNSTYTGKKQKYEDHCVQICHRLINKEDTTLLLTPLTDKRYIKNDSLGIFIVIQEGTVKITNHVYSYMVFMEGRDGYQTIIDEFNKEVENRRQQMEKEIDANIKHSLSNILKSL
jgi:hypothetical protein